jgi:hypothetical protein
VFEVELPVGVSVKFGAGFLKTLISRDEEDDLNHNTSPTEQLTLMVSVPEVGK